ncbi:MAG: aminotransferase class III-fold pyridoxal phosphate-dependent enzyme, partial [Pseudomonadales bacterium]
MNRINTLPPQDIEKLLALDRAHVWHPYASMTEPPSVYPVVSANGVYLQLANGGKLLDGMASWWCVIHGYNHPVLNQALQEQLEEMAHVMLGGITHPQAVALCKKLVDITPAGLQKVFLCDSGSVAVEVAIKLAIQYWYSIGKPEKHRLLTVRSGYHGDTFAAMSVCDPVTGMHHMFRKVLPQQLFAPSPRSKFGQPLIEDDLKEMEQVLEKEQHSIATIILEPIVQGTGGMNFYSAEYLAGVKALCDAYDVLLIADEIATGFGRSGKLFAC